MKTIIERITVRLKMYSLNVDMMRHMRKLQFLTDLTCANFSVTVLWQQPKYIRKHHL